jgi:hypothetical protein
LSPNVLPRRKSQTLRQWFTLSIWALFVLSIPFYIARSGVPQPGNVLIFFVVPISLSGWNRKLPRSSRLTFITLVVFTAWVCLVDYGWAVATNDWELSTGFVLYPLYYVYNALVFLVVLVLYQRYGTAFLKTTIDALTVIVAFQIAASFVFRGGEGNLRGSMFFNNPNQLGYYALLVACLMVLCQPTLKLGVFRTSSTLLGCAYLAFLSASRAAVGGIAILFVLMTFTNRKVLIASLAVILGTAMFGGPIARMMDATEERIEYRKNESLLESRGYDRLWLHEEYLPIGAGEGDFERFADRPSDAKEIHSSAATVLFSYGIVGAILFLIFTVRVLSRSRLRELALAVPVLAYTITHQGLRFTMLWILLAVYLAIKPRPADPRAGALVTSETRT